jgi:hypothetical protein
VLLDVSQQGSRQFLTEVLIDNCNIPKPEWNPKIMTGDFVL